MLKRLKNSQGTVWYGMHMQPGVAEYANNGNPFRVLINEAAAKNLDPTFTGKPVFVQHVDSDEIDDDVDVLRNNADGWVFESFYNPADGKHWTKFITVTKRAERAIKQGYKLSNCYAPNLVEKAGVHNGVSYQREVVGGVYEHLAIVSDPRYQESLILTPEQFKQYNADKTAEISRLSNSKGNSKMGLKFFKREEIKNSKDMDFESLSVLLPKSNKERSISRLINEADERELSRGTPVLVDLSGLVKIGDEEITVEELLARHEAVKAELEEIKATVEDAEEEIDDSEDSFENEDDEEFENEAEEEEVKPKAAPKAKAAVKNKSEVPKEKMKNDSQSAERKVAKEKADRLRNAADASLSAQKAAVASTAMDRVALGKARYGS